MSGDLQSKIPLIGLSLVQYSGQEVVEKLGESIIKDVVISILCGENVRSLTEGLTRRRLALSNAAMLKMFLDANKNIENFIPQLPQLVHKELREKLPIEVNKFLGWLVGITGKSAQNVLRGEEKEVKKYIQEFEKAIDESIVTCKKELGDLEAILSLGELESTVSWPFFQYLFSAIGAQTLSIRGSEKSLYGKLFERLILGSLLSLLGFTYISPDDNEKTSGVFWLSSRGSKRESDATLLLRPGVGIRFDIGFIGPGNTEISLDKVSRFEREMERGSQRHFMSTIVIVDRIGDRSSIVEMAKRINGSIVQMSMAYWVKEICQLLSKKFDYKHQILSIHNPELKSYINEKMQTVNLSNFLQSP